MLAHKLEISSISGCMWFSSDSRFWEKKEIHEFYLNLYFLLKEQKYAKGMQQSLDKVDHNKTNNNNNDNEFT